MYQENQRRINERYERTARIQAEKSNEYTESPSFFSRVAIGAAVGGVAGPLGMAVGAGLGAVVGAFEPEDLVCNLLERRAWRVHLILAGPHAFVICLQIGRFTQEEKATVQLIKEIFGEEAAQYTIVLFTHGDELENNTIESFMEANEDMSEFIRMCENRYHVFNNKIKDQNQVETFLHKINQIIEKNGGKYYTNEMFRKQRRP
ncbi:hypothetical protein WMY93_016999 [Mugilogobius chulae]|uniref:AIG1-type G domain-containing protein n=1 Tax=Mugilogobius chulae TaxID=88201 RepID=A0AAW0NX67_9GOBI